MPVMKERDVKPGFLAARFVCLATTDHID